MPTLIGQYFLRIVLCIALILGFAFNPAASSTTEITTDEIELYPRNEEIGELLPEYSRYDTTDFNADCELLAQAEDSETVLALYDSLYEEYCSMTTLSAVAYINYSRDVTDEYWTEEYTWYDSLITDCSDRLCTACRHVTEGPCAKAFAEHVGQENADMFASYVELTEEEQQLMEQEQELINEYYEQYDNAQTSLHYTYNGRDYTLEDFYICAQELFEEDYAGYSDVCDGLMSQLNQALGSIYLELVQVRDRIAELEGYDNYTEYAYENLYERDYTPEEAAEYCREIKENVAGEFMNDVPYCAGIDCDTDIDRMLEILGEGAADMNPTVYKVWQLMTENSLYDIGSGEGRQEGAYTTTLDSSQTAFIFQTVDGSNLDFSTLTHEFGHFVNAYIDPNPNILTNAGCYDLFEIHSTGLEMLYIPYYSQIYGSDAWLAEFCTVSDKLDSVVYGCLYDEFQQAVYADPDMTLDEMNRLFCELSESYGIYEDSKVDYTWVYNAHNFESPLYYISYSVSALVAIQLWAESTDNYDGAVGHWFQLAALGAYGDGYCQVLADCGLDCFTESGTATEICRTAMDYLESFQ